MFTQECLNLKELEVHIAKFYKVVFPSQPSDYDLLKEAGKSWHKSKKKDKLAPNGWEKKRQDIGEFLTGNWRGIKSEQMVVWFLDECHLRAWGLGWICLGRSMGDSRSTD